MLPEKRRDILIVAITQLITYLFLFPIARHTWDKFIYDFDLFLYIAYVVSGIIYLFSFIKFPTKFLSLFWGIPIMWGLIMLYCPGDAYGISDPGPFGIFDYPAWFDALIFVIKLFLLQCAIKLVLFMGKVVKKKVFPM